MTIGKVMLIDDERDIRTISEISLRRVGGWRVVTVESGERAVEVAGRERPDVILLDVIMPGMDGPATLAALRASADTAAIPIIFMTARAQEGDLALYLKIGARGVIAKPFDPMTLPEAVTRIMAAGGQGSDPIALD